MSFLFVCAVGSICCVVCVGWRGLFVLLVRVGGQFGLRFCLVGCVVLVHRFGWFALLLLLVLMVNSVCLICLLVWFGCVGLACLMV